MIKLLVAILLFLFALLIVVKAPTNFLWLAAVAITNYPVIFIVASCVSLWWGGHSRYAAVTNSFNGMALLLYIIPVVTGFVLAATIPAGIKKVFPVKEDIQRQAAFSFFKLFTPGKNGSYQTFTYKKIDTVNLTFDFFSAEKKSPAPLVIVIHGGSWQSGDSKQLPELNTYLSGRGYNVAAINYRLAPAYKSPAPVEDTRDAVLYFLQHAQEFNIDTNNIFLSGRSAGGQIALTAAYSLHLPCIKGVISYYGPADMVWGGQIKMSKLVLNTDEVYGDYFGGVYDAVPQKFKEASSMEYVTDTSPATLIIHGRIDPLVSFNHGARLQARLNEHHIPNYFLQLPFGTHGCDYNLNGPDGQLCTYATETFLNSVCSSSWKK